MDAPFVYQHGNRDAENGEDPQVTRGEPERLFKNLPCMAVRLDELVWADDGKAENFQLPPREPNGKPAISLGPAVMT